MNEPAFGIKTVSDLTGPGQHTLRAWEARHEAVVADRTKTGRRAYSMDDVQRLISLKFSTDHGESISRIAHLDTHDLEQRAAVISAEGRENAV